MPRRLRIRDRLFWTHGEFCRWPHSYGMPWGPPPWWAAARLTEEEEKEYLEEHVVMLKEELKAAEEELREISKK